MPASRVWSSSRAFSGAALVPSATASSADGHAERIGTQAVLVGVEAHAAEAPGVAEPQLGAVA